MNMTEEQYKEQKRLAEDAQRREEARREEEAKKEERRAIAAARKHEMDEKAVLLREKMRIAAEEAERAAEQQAAEFKAREEAAAMAAAAAEEQAKREAAAEQEAVRLKADAEAAAAKKARDEKRKLEEAAANERAAARQAAELQAEKEMEIKAEIFRKAEEEKRAAASAKVKAAAKSLLMSIKEKKREGQKITSAEARMLANADVENGKTRQCSEVTQSTDKTLTERLANAIKSHVESASPEASRKRRDSLNGKAENSGFEKMPAGDISPTLLRRGSILDHDFPDFTMRSSKDDDRGWGAEESDRQAREAFEGKSGGSAFLGADPITLTKITSGDQDEKTRGMMTAENFRAFKEEEAEKEHEADPITLGAAGVLAMFREKQRKAKEARAAEIAQENRDKNLTSAQIAARDKLLQRMSVKKKTQAAAKRIAAFRPSMKLKGPTSDVAEAEKPLKRKPMMRLHGEAAIAEAQAQGKVEWVDFVDADQVPEDDSDTDFEDVNEDDEEANEIVSGFGDDESSVLPNNTPTLNVPEDSAGSSETPLLSIGGMAKMAGFINKAKKKAFGEVIFTPENLHNAVKEGDVAMTSQLLKASGSDATAVFPPGSGSQPIMWAAHSGNPDLVKLLVEYKADPNSKNKHGYTPLHWAALLDHEKVIESLVSCGATVRQPLKDAYGSTPVHWAAEAGSCNALGALLRSGAPVDSKNYLGETAMHWLAISDGAELHHECISLLARKGADFTIKESAGDKTPLEMAMRETEADNKHLANARVISAHMADQQIPHVRVS